MINRMKRTAESEVKEATKGITAFLVITTFGLLGLMILSPLILLWFGFALFIKILLSLTLLFVLFVGACHLWKKIQEKAIQDLEAETKDNLPGEEKQPLSKFQERLHQLAKDRGIKLD